MSMHEDVMSAIHAEIDSFGAMVDLMPGAVAAAVFQRFAESNVEPHVQWASLEHLKQLARKALAGRYDADSEDNDAHQGELFSHLQDRYPVPREKGADPIYKLRVHMSRQELQWNVNQLRKSARARLLHADALQGYADGRGELIAA